MILNYVTTTSHDWPEPAVGWIGLGSMGLGMAKNIQKHLAASKSDCLKVYNRTSSRCVPVEELGAQRYDTIQELARSCNIIFISVSDDGALVSVVNELIASRAVRETVVIDTTTVHPHTTKAISSKLLANGAHFGAMPVFGAAPVAAAGTLLAAFAGPQDALSRVSRYVKGVIAREVIEVSTEPEKAVLLKTTGNLLGISIMQGVAESLVFAEKTGLSIDVFERLLELNFGPLYSTSRRMTTGVYCPGPGESPWSSLDLAIKDGRHPVEIGNGKGVSIQTGQVALDGLKRARDWAMGEGKTKDGNPRELDSTSLYGTVRMDSGLDFQTELVKERDGLKKKQ